MRYWRLVLLKKTSTTVIFVEKISLPVALRFWLLLMDWGPRTMAMSAGFLPMAQQRPPCRARSFGRLRLEFWKSVHLWYKFCVQKFDLWLKIPDFHATIETFTDFFITLGKRSLMFSYLFAFLWDTCCHE